MTLPWLLERWRRLTGQLESGRLPHALLLCGPAGLGKRALAGAFVARVLCRQATGDEPACGRCRACEQHAAGSHPDFALITLELRDDGKLRTEITIDQIRALSARFALTPQFGGYQIALVDPADAMNQNAANALLKTLEEPSADTLLMLVSDRPARLPATIVSRCTRVEVRFPPREDALAWLQGQGLGTEQADAALELAAGNPGEALEYAGNAARIEEVSAAIADLLAGRAAPSALAARWADEHARLRLRLLAQCLRLLARHLESGAALLDARLREAARLLPGYEFPKLWQAWERVNRALEEIPGPLRTDLSLLAALAEVRDLGAVAA
jgi:DNA polymerase-3 subunit delta'